MKKMQLYASLQEKNYMLDIVACFVDWFPISMKSFYTPTTM